MRHSQISARRFLSFLAAPARLVLVLSRKTQIGFFAGVCHPQPLFRGYWNSVEVSA